MADAPEESSPSPNQNSAHSQPGPAANKDGIGTPLPGGQSGFQRLIQKVGPAVVKTMLDPNAMRLVFNKLSADKELQLKQQKSAPQAFKPLKSVAKFRKASVCAASWDNMDGSGKVRFCPQCQLQVYDFNDMDQSEAEDLVFQREAIKEPQLYRRRDGKFLTRDCPEARKGKLAFMTSAGICTIALIGIFVLSGIPSQKSVNRSSQDLKAMYISQRTPLIGTMSTAAVTKPLPAPTHGLSGSSNPRLPSAEELNAYARLVESNYRLTYKPPANVKNAKNRAVVRFGVSMTGKATGFLLAESSDDADIDTYIINTAVGKQYAPAPYMPGGGVILEATFDGDKVSVIVP